VHPNDRLNDEEKTEVVYNIPCKNCKRVYVGETGRPLGVMIKKHRKEVDSITRIFSRAKRPGQPVSATNLQLQIMFAMRTI